MIWLDILIAISLALGCLLGWKLRAIHLLGILIALIVGILIANRFYLQFTGLFPDLPLPIQSTLAWLTAFFVTAVSISIVSSLVAKAFEGIRLQWLDHLLGAVLALIITLSLLWIGIWVLNHLARTYHWRIIEQSWLARNLLKTGQPLIRQGLNHFPQLKEKLDP